MLRCLGLGLLLAMVRDAVGLILGNGRCLCIVWDLLSFTLAAVLLCGYAAQASASGLARWYMVGAMAAGAISWKGAVSRAIHQLAAALLRMAAFPFRLARNKLLLPVRRHCDVAKQRRKARKLQEKQEKNQKKQLQNATRILYN